ncbi:MAG TPA: hypothetical protein VGH28_06040 [Polyangiaceae bacterium]
MRIARTNGGHVAWAYGGQDAEGLAVRTQWRDADGAIVSSETRTGGMFDPAPGWWHYSDIKVPTFNLPPSSMPVSVEAEVYQIIYKGGRKWTSSPFGWRYASTKPTIVDKNIGIEVTAIEKEWWVNRFQGHVFIEVYNMGQAPLKRVDLECQVHDRSGTVLATITPSWIPTEGDHPIPELLPGVHAQIDMSHDFKDDAASAAWSKKNGLTGSCKVTSVE